ncbi:hypothetical protein C8R46DRAFT_1343232 [Mycena filopes]|nr:hypothetical protein C8R46DRAFT_1343232 [Mycena filopes]
MCRPRLPNVLHCNGTGNLPAVFSDSVPLPSAGKHHRTQENICRRSVDASLFSAPTIFPLQIAVPLIHVHPSTTPPSPPFQFLSIAIFSASRTSSPDSGTRSSLLQRSIVQSDAQHHPRPSLARTTTTEPRSLHSLCALDNGAGEVCPRCQDHGGPRVTFLGRYATSNTSTRPGRFVAWLASRPVKLIDDNHTIFNVECRILSATNDGMGPYGLNVAYCRFFASFEAQAHHFNPSTIQKLYPRLNNFVRVIREVNLAEVFRNECARRHAMCWARGWGNGCLK